MRLLIILGMYSIFVWRGYKIATEAPDRFGFLVAAGITTWIACQTLLNISVNLSLFPLTGITLPFVSAGGSSLLVSFAAIGILLSISRETLPRGTWNDADPDRRRWHRRPRLPGVGRRAQPARAGA